MLCIAAIRLFYGAAVRLLASARDQTADSVDAGWGSVGLALGCLAVAGVLGVVLHRVEREQPTGWTAPAGFGPSGPPGFPDPGPSGLDSTLGSE